MTHYRTMVFATLLAACASSSPEQARELIYYPEPPDPPRLQFLRSISDGREIEQQESSVLDTLLFGDKVAQPKPIPKPGSVTFRDGVFYVSDTEMAGIMAIDLKQQKVEPVRLQGRARLINPLGMCLGPDDKFYIADRGRRQVVVLDSEFGWDREFGPWSDDSGPTDVAVWQDRLYVAESHPAARVHVLSLPEGEVIQVLGKVERKEEYLRGPSNLTVDENGYVYVVDTVLSRIFVWDKDGNFVRQIASPGDASGHLARPKGIAYYNKLLWVLDSAFNNCQIFDLAGGLQGHFSSAGSTPGSMAMPRKIWVGSADFELFEDLLEPDFVPEALVVVSNTYGPRLNFYAYGGSTKFTYPEIDFPERPTPVDPADAGAETAEPAETGRQP